MAGRSSMVCYPARIISVPSERTHKYPLFVYAPTPSSSAPTRQTKVATLPRHTLAPLAVATFIRENILP